MKKAQLNPFIFNIALFIIIAFVTISLGIVIFNSISKNTSDSEKLNFLKSLENSLKQASAGEFGQTGSIKELTLSVPKDIEEICFVDRQKPLSTSKSEFDIYDTHNVFFKEAGRSESYSVSFLSAEDNPTCILPEDGIVSINIKKQGPNAVITAPKQEQDDLIQESKKCVSVFYNKENNIDIVFLSHGYTKKDEFTKDVNYYISEVIGNFTPFSESTDKFNYYMIYTDDVDCSIDSYIKCDEYNVKKIASDCPNDYIIVLVDRNKIANMLLPVRSSAISNMVAINTIDNPNVLIHEFGHAFGHLADEYVDEEYYSTMQFSPLQYPNCDYKDCSKWSNVLNTGCYKGCSLGTFFRPTSNSIMRSLKSDTFGPVNENEIKRRLLKYE